MVFEPIRKARIEAGYPTALLAQAVRRSLAYVYQVERGILVPSREDAEALAALFDATPEELFTRIRSDEKRAA